MSYYLLLFHIQELLSKIIGQDEIIHDLCNLTKKIQLGFQDSPKIHTFLLAGSTGIGKTYLVKEYASLLYGKNHFIRLDMSEYKEEHSVSKILGAPPGYVGFGEGGQLSEQIRRHPYSVLLFDEIEKALDAKLAEYKGAVFTEESKSIAKSEVANLRKLKKDFEDARKGVKKEWMKPYEDFEAKMKNLTEKIDEPICLIDSQLKDFERKRREERREKIKEIYQEIIGDMEEYCDLGRIYDTKWENATTTMRSIRESIATAVESARIAVSTISGMQSDAVEKALEIYKDSQDMAKAVAYINNYEQQKAEIMRREEERRRQEEERRRLAEEKRIRVAEREAIEREARIREQARQEAEARESQAARQEAAVAPLETEKSGGDDVMPFVQPDTRTVFYHVVASDEDIQAIDMALDSIGVYYERRDG